MSYRDLMELGRFVDSLMLAAAPGSEEQARLHSLRYRISGLKLYVSGWRGPAVIRAMRNGLA